MTLALVCAGCAQFAPVPRPTHDPAPRIPGEEEEPFDLVGEGESSGLGWRLLSYDGPDRLSCLQVETVESSSADCNEPQYESAIWLLTHGADLTHGDERLEAIYGVASADVARLEVQFEGGRVEELDFLPMRIGDRDAAAFVLIHLEDDHAVRVNAYDASGAVIDGRNVRQLAP